MKLKYFLKKATIRLAPLMLMIALSMTMTSSGMTAKEIYKYLCDQGWTDFCV